MCSTRSITLRCCSSVTCPRQDSNLRPRLRRPGILTSTHTHPRTEFPNHKASDATCALGSSSSFHRPLHGAVLVAPQPAGPWRPLELRAVAPWTACTLAHCRIALCFDQGGPLRGPLGAARARPAGGLRPASAGAAAHTPGHPPTVLSVRSARVAVRVPALVTSFCTTGLTGASGEPSRRCDCGLVCLIRTWSRWTWR
jgi:hypothetical protein